MKNVIMVISGLGTICGGPLAVFFLIKTGLPTIDAFIHGGTLSIIVTGLAILFVRASVFIFTATRQWHGPEIKRIVRKLHTMFSKKPPRLPDWGINVVVGVSISAAIIIGIMDGFASAALLFWSIAFLMTFIVHTINWAAHVLKTNP